MISFVAPHIVYALLDPETYDVRYVGQSCSMYKRALEPHSAYCGSWMKSLASRGLEPIVRVLFATDDEQECTEVETRFIAFYRKVGFDMTNIMDGGKGVSKGYKQPKDLVEKRAAKLRGKKRDPSIGRKVSQTLLAKGNHFFLTCVTCNKEFRMPNCRKNKKQDCCSRVCSLEKLRQRKLKRLQNGY